MPRAALQGRKAQLGSHLASYGGNTLATLKGRGGRLRDGFIVFKGATCCALHSA